MRTFKSIGLGLVAGLALTAMALPSASDANANVIVYSSLEVSNLRITSGLEFIDLSSVAFTNSTRSNASFTGAPGVTWNDPSDANLSCVDFSQVSSGVPGDGWQFARGDALLTGSVVNPANPAAGYTVGEMNLLSGEISGTGGGEAGTNAAARVIEFMVGDGVGDIVLEFDAIGELLALSDSEFGSGQASFAWTMTIRNADTNAFVTEFTPEELNQNVGLLNEAGLDSYSVDDSFLFTISGLQANTRYRVLIDHRSDVNAALRVSAPATLAVLGLGLLGLGAVARRRRLAA